MVSEKLQKIVLSRTKRAHAKIGAMEMFRRLNHHYATTFNYMFSIEDIGCWLGASPELLFSLNNNELECTSLAGTKLPGESWTDKEMTEQQYVTDFITSKLGHLNAADIQTDGPSTIFTGTVEHLKTKINTQLGKDASWKEVAKLLHPTPAVCGVPARTAREFILENELHDRKFYTGYIGLVRPDQQKFFVNLRCLELHNDEALLYLGGGITALSQLESEWRETDRKAETLLKILN